MECLVQVVDIEVVVHMLMAETSRWTAGALLAPVVVVVRYVQVAKVDIPELVVVSDKGGLPVVVEVVP